MGGKIMISAHSLYPATIIPLVRIPVYPDPFKSIVGERRGSDCPYAQPNPLQT